MAGDLGQEVWGCRGNSPAVGFTAKGLLCICMPRLGSAGSRLAAPNLVFGRPGCKLVPGWHPCADTRCCAKVVGSGCGQADGHVCSAGARAARARLCEQGHQGSLCLPHESPGDLLTPFHCYLHRQTTGALSCCCSVLRPLLTRCAEPDLLWKVMPLHAESGCHRCAGHCNTRGGCRDCDDK